MKIGFVGLGIMGKPMSKNLRKAGYELVVCDITRATVAELAHALKGSAGTMGAVRMKEIAQEIVTLLPPPGQPAS